MLNKVTLLVSLFFLPINSYANTGITSEFPTASFTYINDAGLLERIGLKTESGAGAWCYNTEANAILITAAAREKASCQLEMQYKMSEQKIRYDLRISNLELRIDTLTKQHEDILSIKDKEIDRLTVAATKRPNDYTVWWASGGFLAGVATTLLIVFSL